MRIISITVLLLLCSCLVECFPRISTKRHFQQKLQKRRLVKRLSKQVGDPYFNEYKFKRSRNDESDVGTFGNDLTGDMFGIHPQESVRLMSDERSGPIGKATNNFVDPFNDMVDEPPLSQYAYKPHQREYTSTTDDGASYKSTGEDQLFQSHATLQEPHLYVTKGSSQLHISSGSINKHSASPKNSKLSFEDIRKLLQATDQDTEKEQTKGTVLKYKKKNKKENTESRSSQFSYLSLPDTQSVDITPMKSKPTEEKEDSKKVESESKSEDSNRKVESGSSKSLELMNVGNEGQSASEPEHRLPEDSTAPDIDTTPPSENAEVVPSEVVDVKEDQQAKQAADEMTTIVNAATEASPSSKVNNWVAVDSTNATLSNQPVLKNETTSTRIDQTTKSETVSSALSEGGQTAPTDSIHMLDQTKPVPQAPRLPAPKPNKVIDIKEPDLNVSISFNSTDNQDRSVERLENVIKMVKGMKDGDSKASPLTALVNTDKPLTKDEKSSEMKQIVEPEPLKSLLATANTTTKVNESAKEKDYSYIMHKGNLYKVSKVSPEKDSLNNEPSNKLAALDYQLSKLVMDTASRMSLENPSDESSFPVSKFSSTKLKSDEQKGKIDINIESFPLKDQEKKKKTKGKEEKQKENDGKEFGDKEGEAASDEEDGDQEVDEGDVTKTVRNKHMKGKHLDADTNEGDEERRKEGSRRHHKRLSHHKTRHGISKKKHRVSNEDADSEDGFGLEYKDEDEQENEKVPYPTKSKKNKKKGKKFSDESEEDQNEDNDEQEKHSKKKKKNRKHRFNNDEDDEEADMSIHMLNKVNEKTSSEDEGLGEERVEENGNELQGKEDAEDGVGDQEEKSGKDEENIDEESIASVIKSKQKSKKLFGASLRRFKMAHQAAVARSKQRNMTFYVGQGTDGDSDVIMKTKVPVKAGETIVMGEDLSKSKILQKSASAPTLSGSSLTPGYTIKLFTNPKQHSRTYEIKHGNRFYTVVESDEQGESKSNIINPDGADDDSGDSPSEQSISTTASQKQSPSEINQASKPNEKLQEIAANTKSNLTQGAPPQFSASTKQQSSTNTKQQPTVSLHSKTQKEVMIPQHIMASVVDELYRAQPLASPVNTGNSITKENSRTLDKTNDLISSKTFDLVASDSAGFNKIDALKTIIPALIGTRKGVLSTDPKITDYKDSPTNSLSREIQGVTSLSPLKKSATTAPVDDFDKTLNEHIVLK